MSFLKSVGSFVADTGKSMVKDAMEKQERIQRYMERLDKLSDEELFEKMNSSHDEMKMACIQLLKDRGYGPQ